MRTFRLWGAPICPTYLALIDAATPAKSDQAPNPGDLTICAYCRTVLQFTDELGLKKLEDDEIAALPREERELVGKIVRGLELAPIPLGARHGGAA